ncbi:MAG: hypothetical protein HQL82_06310 [Magnetococcales bacterium]|nr:hypothetical protein [Magnetococcales bacterium]
MAASAGFNLERAWKLGAATLILLAGIPVSLPVPARGDQQQPAFSARVVRSHPSDREKNSQGHMYVGPLGIRTESTVGGEAIHVIFQRQPPKALVLFPSRKEYMEQPGADSTPPPLPDHPDSPCRTHDSYRCLKKGLTTVGGRDTEHWVVTVIPPGEKPRDSQMWIDRRLGIAIREAYPDGSLVELTDIREAPQDRQLFTLPEGYRLVTLPESGAPPAPP